jgi:hypothetical protein
MGSPQARDSTPTLPLGARLRTQTRAVCYPGQEDGNRWGVQGCWPRRGDGV